MASTVLVVGGAGYIGSHTCKALDQAGFLPVTYDDLSTGHAAAVRWGPLVEGRMSNSGRLKAAITEHKPVAAMLFAGFIAVGESVSDPARYYRNNVGETLSLLDTFRKTNLKRMVFSSTAAVYGNPKCLPIQEDHPLQPTSPYGRTKLMVERILGDYASAYAFRSISLRYFNAAGGDPDGLIGENHNPETHLIPLVLDAALGRSERIDNYGDDYETPDGTCVRDYIHVDDLASAHVQALHRILDGNQGCAEAYNLGNGNGFSVREVIDVALKVTSKNIPIRVAARRPGDPASLISAADKAREILDWKPNGRPSRSRLPMPGIGGVICKPRNIKNSKYAEAARDQPLRRWAIQRLSKSVPEGLFVIRPAPSAGNAAPSFVHKRFSHIFPGQRLFDRTNRVNCSGRRFIGLGGNRRSELLR